MAVGAHAAQIDLRLGDPSRRLQDIGVGAFADNPLRKGFDVARQIGIKRDRHVETVTKASDEARAARTTSGLIRERRTADRLAPRSDQSLVEMVRTLLIEIALTSKVEEAGDDKDHA